MQINGYSGNLPLSTQVINKYGPANPEQVNKAVDAASDRVAERQVHVRDDPRGKAARALRRAERSGAQGNDALDFPD